MATFTWTQDYGSELTESPRVLSASFGDGYVQDVVDGINVNPRKWSVTFANRKYAESDAILEFLRRNYLAFDWIDPDGKPGRWKCTGWRRSHPDALVKTLSAEFEEVFGR